MDNLENTYNQAIEMIKNGRSKEEVLLRFNDEQKELAPLLEISSALLSLPKNIAPAPAMQRKYAFAPSRSFWLNWIHISKLAGASISSILLISAFIATGYAAKYSTAGQTLFNVKKFAEKIELDLANNQNEKANIQLAITQQRLSEAQAVFDNPSSDTSQKAAALNELADQTNNAVAIVGTVAKDNPTSSQNHPLLNSLENITRQQQTLLAQIKPDKQIQSAASSALLSLKQNTQQLSRIQQSVAVADNNQTLAQISKNPNAVTVLGLITQISGSQITVDKNNIFAISEQTSIQDAEGNATSTSGLTLNTKVNVIGLKNQNNITAQKIAIIQASSTDAEGQPQVKSASTTQAASVSSATSSTASDKRPAAESSTTPPSAVAAQQNPDAAFGTFILEDPNPQFVK